MSSRRLQDVLIKANLFALVIGLQKTSSKRLDQDQYIRLRHTSSRHLQHFSSRLQDVFKTPSRRLQDDLQIRFQDIFKHLQDILKTSSRSFEDVFKTSSSRLAKMGSRQFQDESSV